MHLQAFLKRICHRYDIRKRLRRMSPSEQKELYRLYYSSYCSARSSSEKAKRRRHLEELRTFWNMSHEEAMRLECDTAALRAEVEYFMDHCLAPKPRFKLPLLRAA